MHCTSRAIARREITRKGVTGACWTSSRVIEEGRNAVRGLGSATSADDLEEARRASRRSSPSGGCRLPRHRRGQAQPLNPLIRDQVFRIAREALVNAFRHSGAQKIELEIEYAAGDLRLLVRDNGRGIDADVLRSGSEGHWGLSGMRERADQIGARFTVWSRAAAGTEVELVVPARVAFVRKARRGRQPRKVEQDR
jgi:signal transduction histidine kinase